MTAARSKPRESGFALLLVFLMAAAIAITLYMEIPRVAFDSQRQKEQMLIERGEQYKRAIQLFVKKNSRYPARIEELESFNNLRYLRRRYKDPITGKEEWRLIHFGPGGVFTDSLVNKPKTQEKDPKANTNTFIAEGPAIGSTLGAGQQAVNPAMRRRASEGGTPGGTVIGPDGMPVEQQPGTAGIAPLPGMPGLHGQTVPQAQAMPGQNFPGQAGAPTGQPYPGQPGMPGQNMPGQPGVTYPGQPGVIYPGQQGVPYPGQPGVNYPGQPGVPFPGQPGITYPGSTPPAGGGSTAYVGGSTPYIGGSASGYPGMPGQPMGGRFPGMPGMPVSSQTGGVSPYPIQAGSQGASPPYPQPGLQTGQNAAVQMIQQILTSPRPNMPTANAGMMGLNIGPGIAGVASTSEEEGILVYNDKTKYNEWEFIYDPTKEKRPVNPSGGAIGTPAANMGSNAGSTSPTGANSNSGTSPFGNNSGFSGFGSSGIGQTPQPNTGFGQTSQPNTGFGRP